MHYRAALALDPTHNAANRNLERIVSRNFPFADMDLGDEPEPHGHHFGGKHEKK
jgi:hypothetical protein